MIEISNKVPKNKYLVEEEFEEEEEGEEINIEVLLENLILKILSKNRVDSKLTLTNLLISSGIKDYELRLNLSSNEAFAEIPNIGRILKKLRFEKKINFSIINGSHAYYIDKEKKMVSRKKSETKFNWKSYNIPEGTDDIYLVFKIPGSNINSHHFLMSCFPSAEISGFKIIVNKKFEETSSFNVKGNQISGRFDEDKLILNCKTTNENIDRTLYTVIQIGRTILTEFIKLNFRYSEILQIFFPIKSDFFPVVPIFRSEKQGAFYKTKYSNSLRVFYDFPLEFKGKLIYGKQSLIINGEKEEDFDLDSYLKFISEALEFQAKAFISLSIVNNWIINPTKAMNYMEEDDDLRKLVEEYKQDIDTDRIIQERLEESLEKGEFFKEITSNLLLTFLGVSLLSDWPPLQWAVVGILIIINVYYFIKRRKKFKKRTQID
ncbi:MAG: hypothetical protein ACW98D_05545 [Promethearchaeota archaeon]